MSNGFVESYYIFSDNSFAIMPVEPRVYHILIIARVTVINYIFVSGCHKRAVIDGLVKGGEERDPGETLDIDRTIMK